MYRAEEKCHGVFEPVEILIESRVASASVRVWPRVNAVIRIRTLAHYLRL